MNLLRGRWASPGFGLTALAAGLIVALSLVSNPWTQLVRIGQGPSRGVALLGTLVVAAALLDRWRPMRFLARYGCWAATLSYTLAAAFGARPTGGFLAVAAAYLVPSALLASKPVRSWFARPRNAWDSVEDEEEPSAEATMLPREKVEPELPTTPPETVGARSNPSNQGS